MTTLAEVAKANWGEKSQAGSKGVMDNASYDASVRTALRRKRQQHHSEAAIVGGASAAAGAAFPHGGGGWKRRLGTAAVEGAIGAGAVEGVRGVTRGISSRKMGSPETRTTVERRVVNNMARKTGATVNQAKWGTTSKAASPEKKRKEQQFGLANNAFGAAAGALGTKAVYQQAKAKQTPEAKAAAAAASEAKQAKRVEQGKHAFTPLQRAGQKVAKPFAKLPAPVKRLAAPAALAGAVGSQVVNAGADAQSALYFGNELREGRQKSKSVAKSFSDNARVGRRISDSVEVSKRRFDSEADRQHRLGIYEGLGATGVIAGGAGGVYGLKRQGVKLGNVGRKLAKHKLPLAAVGAGTLSGGGAVAARRAYTRDRNEAWT